MCFLFIVLHFESCLILALDLLLNVQQDDYLPLVTQSAGIRLSVHPNGTKPFLTSKGISITTGFETHVVLQQKKSIRYAGSKGDRCDQNNTYSGVLVSTNRVGSMGIY